MALILTEWFSEKPRDHNGWKIGINIIITNGMSGITEQQLEPEINPVDNVNNVKVRYKTENCICQWIDIRVYSSSPDLGRIDMQR